MRFRVKALLAILAVAGVSTAALAQVKPGDAIRAQQSIMRVVALDFGPLANAARMETLWTMNPWKFFIAGTDKQVAGAKIASFNDAKAEV